MDNNDIVPPLHFKNFESVPYEQEYEMECHVPAPNPPSSSNRDMVSARSSIISSPMLTARSLDSAKLPINPTADPTDIAKKLYGVFKISEEICDSKKLKFNSIKINETCECVIGHIASASIFILPWNVIKLVLAIFWVKILEEFDNPNKLDLDNVKVLYMWQILKFTKPFLTVQRFAEVLFHQPYKKIDKFLNATVRMIFVRETNHVVEPNECMYTSDVIALVKITNKWLQMLGERIKQSSLDLDEDIWSSSETEKSDKKEDEPPEEKKKPVVEEVNKRDFDESDESNFSKRAKTQEK